ncbi:MAG: DUF3313 domain-containing protein [Nitrospirae bacterium]|nr:DUF3313 domain-containing protein [Nitrospirota bacterium]
MKAGKRILFVIIGSILIIASGCAQKQVKYSGFLENYPTFQPGPKGGVDFVYLKEGVDFSKYNKVMLDYVVFYLKKDSEHKGIQAEEMKEMADAFHLAAVKALQGAYPIVGEPGADVLRVRVAITDLEPSNPAASGITTVIPVGLAISAIKKGVTGKHTGVGGAGIEAEFLDSLTNERLAAAIDKQEGSKLSGLTKFGAAKDAFEFWSERLKIFLDNVHGIK